MKMQGGIGLLKYIGRSYDTYNCFDLVKEFYMDHFNLDLRNYFEGGPVPGREEVESLIVSNKGDFIKVEGKPQFGDIVVLRLYGLECHIGVCVNTKQFLHSAKKIGSNMDRFDRWGNMVVGFYRHREYAL